MNRTFFCILKNTLVTLLLLRVLPGGRRRSSLAYFSPVLSSEARKLQGAESEGFKAFSWAEFRRHTSRASGGGHHSENPFDLDSPVQTDERGRAVSAFCLSRHTSRASFEESSELRTLGRAKFVGKEFQECMESITASLSRLSRRQAHHFTPFTDSPDSSGSSGARFTSGDSVACASIF